MARRKKKSAEKYPRKEEKKIIHDEELGDIEIRLGERTRYNSLRLSYDGEIIARMPANGSEQALLDFIEKHRERFVAALKEHQTKRPLISDREPIKANGFTIQICCAGHGHIKTYAVDDTYYIVCPLNRDFEDKREQRFIKEYHIEPILCHEAFRYLPKRVETLAAKYRFTYSYIDTSSSKSRWGSCNSKREIRLSTSLMFLPDHLIDYVILHELCHTAVMNHGEEFWKLMNVVTKDKALALRKELREYRIL
ncbi:MAG: M48 family metallopeptidase [Tannerellaceae bacterium]|nr:M48 family metallopeptidase [Tannerellaceae bacterium]